MNNREPENEDRKPVSSDWPYCLALGLMGLVIFFYRLGAPGLMDPDEGRYAEIAREIFVLQDWLVPHLNLFPYLEKPPLVYWLTALSFKVLGYGELAARLPAAVSALGGLMLAYGLGRAMWGPAAGFFGATVLATSAGYVALGRILTLDMTFSLLVNLAIGLGYLALSRKRRGLWPWAYGSLALAVLAKGLAALVLAGLTWGVWVLFFSPPTQPSPLKEEGLQSRVLGLRQLYQPWAWLLLAGLALPWFVYLQGRFPEYFQYFVLEQHFGRFLTPAIHPEPFYYFAPVLLGLFLPWTFLLPWGVWVRGEDRDPDRNFLLIWVAVVVVFFSLSRGKLPPYILPALLPLALLLGRRLAGLSGAAGSLSSEGRLRMSLGVWALAGCGLTAVLLWQPVFLTRTLARANLTLSYLHIAAGVFTLTPLAALAGRRLSLLWLGVGALMLSALLPVGLERLSAERSPREMGRLVRSLEQPGDALVGVYLYSQGISFYSGRIFHLMEGRTELDFGRKLVAERERELYFATVAEMGKFARSRPQVFFYLKETDLKSLKPELPGKFTTLARQGDCLLLAYRRE